MEKYLLSKVELCSVQTLSKKKKTKEPKGYGILDGVVPEISASGNEGPADEINSGVLGGYSEGMLESAFVEKEAQWECSLKTDTAESKDSKPLPPVHFYALESDQPILDILKPSVIVVYHPDMSFVREIEVYKAENPFIFSIKSPCEANLVSLKLEEQKGMRAQLIDGSIGGWVVHHVS